MISESLVQQCSTHDMPKPARLDFWMERLAKSTWPISDWSGISPDFRVDMQEARLGCLSTIKETMCGAPRARRTRRDVENSTESGCCLFMTDGPVTWIHNGHHSLLRAGDVVLIGHGEHDSHMPSSGFQSTIVKLPLHWLETWIPDPDALAGRAIPRDSRWGRMLSPMVQQLAPEFVASPVLPPAVLVDQLGATLALIANERDDRAPSDLFQRIQDCVRERCVESTLTAADVATSLNVPLRVLHRALAAKHRTFVAQLVESRIDVALEMLTSPACAHLAPVDIAHRAGFSSYSHFARIVRKHTGVIPSALRRQPGAPC